MDTNQDLTNTGSSDFYENPENVVEKQTITIRHVHCIQDMVEAFSDKNILDANFTLGFRRLLENSELEMGVGSGVIMDCLTDFWSTSFATKTCGNTYKREWEAVARIVAFGWQMFKYLPAQLAPPFLTVHLLGKSAQLKRMC